MDAVEPCKRQLRSLPMFGHSVPAICGHNVPPMFTHYVAAMCRQSVPPNEDA
jgi:hypothetical protein